MLVLSRRLGETIRIGQSVTVTVTGIQGNRVKLGFQAPDGIEILRAELIQEWKEFGLEDVPETADNYSAGELLVAR